MFFNANLVPWRVPTSSLKVGAVVGRLLLCQLGEGVFIARVFDNKLTNVVTQNVACHPALKTGNL